MRKNILKILIICMSVTFALGIFTACDNNGENLQDDNHNHNYTATVTEPTCTEQGYTTYTCECGESYKDNYTDALGHDYVWTTTKQPTETTKGTETGVCSRCQDTITRDIPELNHEHSYTETIVAPTCTAKGYTLHKCSCGYEYRTDETEKIPHTPLAAVEENRIEAKCEENGSYDSVVYCAVCGTELSRERKVLNATGHDFGDWIETTAPTCTTKGVETRYCSHDHSHTETRPIGELGHNYSVPTYTWSADNKTCTAERICLRDSNHRETETVNTTANIIQYQSCETDELTTYTAVFTNSAFATQTRANIKTKDKLGHNYSAPTYVWSADNKTCTAERVCLGKYRVIYLDYDYSNSNYQTKDKSSKAEEVLIVNY